MRGILAVLFVAVFLISGCASTGDEPVSVYTFQKDRVDQKVTGNQGYLTGDAPEKSSEGRKTTRTLIGVDIELPGGSSGKEPESSQGSQPKKAPAPVTTQKTRGTEVEVKEKAPERTVNEEDYIK